MSTPTSDKLRTSANKAYAMGDLEKALRLYTKGSTLDPSSAALHSNASAALYELGRYEESFVRTIEAIVLEEDAGKERSPALAAKLALRRVKLLIQLRRYDEAIELSDGSQGDLEDLGWLATHLAGLTHVAQGDAHKLAAALPIHRGTYSNAPLEYFYNGHDYGE